MLVTGPFRHYPIGLLYDILCISERSYQQQPDTEPLPWCINVHFQNYPAGNLFRDQSKTTARDFFMSMIKEVKTRKDIYSANFHVALTLAYCFQADFLRFGSTKRVMNLSKSDQSQLWESLCSSKYLPPFRLTTTNK